MFSRVIIFALIISFNFLAKGGYSQIYPQEDAVYTIAEQQPFFNYKGGEDVAENYRADV